MVDINVVTSPDTRELLCQNDLSISDLERWGEEYLVRLGLATSPRVIWVYADDTGASSTHGCFYPKSHEICIYLPRRFEASDLKGVLLHELVHFAQALRCCQFQLPQTGNTSYGSWEFAVLYFATSRTELEALAWQATVDPASYELLKEAVRMRLRR